MMKHVTEMLRPSPYCDAVSRRDDTKTIKPMINKAFVASGGEIITDYNDLYCLFMSRCIVPHKHYHVCICDRRNTNNKHYSTRSKLTFDSSEAESCLQAVSQTLAKLERVFVHRSIVDYSTRFSV